MPSPDDLKGWLLYDGHCGMCSRGVLRWQRLLKPLHLGVAALQEPWVHERVGLPEDELLKNVRLLFADGRQLVGANVYRYVLQHRWWGYPLYLLSITPGLSRLFDGTYRLVADHRKKISTVCKLTPVPHDESRVAAPFGD